MIIEIFLQIDFILINLFDENVFLDMTVSGLYGNKPNLKNIISIFSFSLLLCFTRFQNISCRLILNTNIEFILIILKYFVLVIM